MTLYVYLVVFPESVKTPAHWAVLITPVENGKVGQEFQAIGSPFHGYNLEVKEEFDLSKEFKKHSCVFLGSLGDSWKSQLAGVAQSVAAPGISSTPLDPFAVRLSYRQRNYLRILFSLLKAELTFIATG